MAVVGKTAVRPAPDCDFSGADVDRIHVVKMRVGRVVQIDLGSVSHLVKQ
jgi:hypothetical protein